MEPMAVTVDLVIIAILFVIAVLLTRDRSRAWLLAQASELAGRYGRPEHTPEWELEHAELWLMARRKQLTEDLASDRAAPAARRHHVGHPPARQPAGPGAAARLAGADPGRAAGPRPLHRVRATAVRDGRALARPGPSGRRAWRCWTSAAGADPSDRVNGPSPSPVSRGERSARRREAPPARPRADAGTSRRVVGTRRACLASAGATSDSAAPTCAASGASDGRDICRA